ncbi:uncharacterized protein KRP23_341 [Phytophthora ramorum]|uniref:uncharacterized protein n=1 Tax=Phytophthora ramorum TaxID=164328 RepID=UPI0030ACD964|nr:hypothetical protein KRP23_341 [Phytophthora ramorum]
MHVSQVLLAATVTLFATSADVATASDAAVAAKTKSSAVTNEIPELFVKKIPFKYGNVTGTMVITIDPDSLREADDDSASTDASKVYDFTQSDESGSDAEERALFGSKFMESLVLGFNGWRNMWTRFKLG